MKKAMIIFLSLFMNCLVFSQEYNVSKTEVLVDVQQNKWSQTTENAFVESISLIPGGSLEITSPNKGTSLIYKLEIEIKQDKDGNKVMKFSPVLDRGTDSEIEITMINGKPAFAYGHSKGWHRSEPNKIVVFRFWF